MNTRSIHEAAVAVGARGLSVGRFGDTELERSAVARTVVVSLARASELQTALQNTPCLHFPDQEKCGGATRGVNVRFHLGCIFAALGAVNE